MGTGFVVACLFASPQVVFRILPELLAVQHSFIRYQAQDTGLVQAACILNLF